MSSYVISKSEFVRVAGIIAALNETKTNYSSSLLHFYNIERGRLYDGSELIVLLLDAYKCNALSVVKQYNDLDVMIEPEQDYAAILEETKQEVKEKYRKDPNYLLDLAMKLSSFAACFSYQTEDQELCKKGMNILNDLIQRVLYAHVQRTQDIVSENMCWGRITL